MATYHVKITGDDATGDGSEGLPWRTIDFAMTQCLAGGTSFESSADEVLVWYGGTASDYAGDWSTVVRRGVPVIGVDSAGYRWDDFTPWGGGPADRTGVYARNERPTVQTSSGTRVIQTYEWQSWYGLILDGDAKTTNFGFFPSGTREYKVVDCIVRNIGTGGAFTGVESGSIFLRCTVHTTDCPVLGTARPNVTVKGLIAYDCAHTSGDTLAVDGNSVVKNCVIYNCGTAGANSAFGTTSGTATVENCVALDNLGAYGMLTGPTYDACYSWSTNPGVYHFTDNWEAGSPPSGNFEADPQFEDPASNDFMPATGSPLIGAGAAISDPDFAWDSMGTEWASPPSIGAVERAGVALITAISSDTRTVAAVFDGQVQSSTIDSPEDWTVVPVSVGNKVSVVSATPGGSGTTCTLVVFPDLTPGAIYTVTAVNAEEI